MEEQHPILAEAMRFVAEQRARRDDRSPTYHRDGSHVTVGEVRPLSPDFLASHETRSNI
jgi:hypothetical protein